MRRLMRGLLIVLVGLLCLAIAASAAPPGQSGNPIGRAPGDRALPFLFEDDAYLRQGAITTMETCLAVADDPAASRRWQDLDRNVTGSASALAGWLQDPNNPKRTDDGFGTLLACAQVVAAWHVSLPDRELADGRMEHGAVILDLLLADGKRARIDPLPLVRLLTSPGLLPRVTFGGIVVRNAIVDGPLLLYNLHLRMPLVFVDMEFRGGPYQRGVFASDDTDSGTVIEGTAISIQRSDFSDYVAIVDGTICGSVRIFNSSFRDSLDLRQAEQRGAGCESPNGDQAGAFVWVQSSSFAQSLTLSGSALGQVMAYSNDISSLLLRNNQFAGGLSIEDNDIRSLQIEGSVASGVEINYNRIANDFLMGGPAGEDDPVGVVPAEVNITSNRIGGGFVFGGEGFDFASFDAAALPATLDLRSNQVGNGSGICLPPRWDGRVLLDGSRYDGTLTVGLSAGPLPDGMAALQATELAESSVGQGACAGVYLADPDRTGDGGTYCVKPGDVTVDLRATEIGTLQWHLPLTCRYRWSGFGLSYQLWTPHELAGTEQKMTHAAFLAWRRTLAHYNDPASLDTMSQYFAGKGEYVASRTLQEEAKRLNYATECPPHEDTWTCIGIAVMPPEGERSDAGTASGEGWRDWGESHRERAWQGFKLALLWPGGFGARPEQALALLFGSTIVMAMVYWLYIGAVYLQVRARGRRVKKLGRSVPESSPAGPRLAALSARYEELRATRQHRDLKQEILPELNRIARDEPTLARRIGRLTRVSWDFGQTEVYGFSQFSERMPTRFTPLRYSIDTMIPVIDLHAYSSYYPESKIMRAVTIIQHICGWWLLTVFVASAAIL